MTSEKIVSGKISGYLEKKGKLRIGSPWRKYWFVLEGRLLLYYRSKVEYDTIRPCKGSVSLCPPCNVKLTHNTHCTFQIECRYSTVTLRAENRIEQEKWMQAIMLSTSQTKITPNRMNHFRYSLDDLPDQAKRNKENVCTLIRQNTLPRRFKSPKRERKEVLDKIHQLPQHSSKSISTLNNISSKEKYTKSPRLPKNKNLCRLLKQSNSLHNVVREASDDNNENCLLNKSQSYEEIVESSGQSKKGDEIKRNKHWKSDGHLVASRSSTGSLLHTPIEEEKDTTTNNRNNYTENEAQLIASRKNSLQRAYHEERQYENIDEVWKHQMKLKEEGGKERHNNQSQSSSYDGKTKHKDNRIKAFLNLVKLQKDNEDTPKKITRSQSFVKKLLRRKSKSFEKDNQEVAADKDEVRKSLSDSQKLMQLQRIMESRRQSLRKSITDAEVTNEPTNNGKQSNGNTTTTEEDKPSLPPRKNQNRRPTSPYHDTPRTSNPIILIETRSSTASTVPSLESPGNYKTIEEILVELDEQKHIEKETIKSTTDDVEDFLLQDVELRKKTHSPDANRHFAYNGGEPGEIGDRRGRYSSELGVLLEELAKITSAPVLNVGTTYSLVTPVTVSEEWLEVIPSRRRMSDPDYDIPRPHTSLQFNNRGKPSPENVIPATQFFGPVLSSPPKTNSPTLQRVTSWNSIDPDSLEPTHRNSSSRDSQDSTSRQKEEWLHNVSYTSHDYNQRYRQVNEKTDDTTILSYNYNMHKESLIYSDSNEFDVKMNQEKQEIIYNFKEELKRVNNENIRETFGRSQEQFIDSLEPSAEISTTL